MFGYAVEWNIIGTKYRGRLNTEIGFTLLQSMFGLVMELICLRFMLLGTKKREIKNLFPNEAELIQPPMNLTPAKMALKQCLHYQLQRNGTIKRNFVSIDEVRSSSTLSSFKRGDLVWMFDEHQQKFLKGIISGIPTQKGYSVRNSKKETLFDVSPHLLLRRSGKDEEPPNPVVIAETNRIRTQKTSLSNVVSSSNPCIMNVCIPPPTHRSSDEPGPSEFEPFIVNFPQSFGIKLNSEVFPAVGPPVAKIGIKMFFCVPTIFFINALLNLTDQVNLEDVSTCSSLGVLFGSDVRTLIDDGTKISIVTTPCENLDNRDESSAPNTIVSSEYPKKKQRVSRELVSLLRTSFGRVHESIPRSDDFVRAQNEWLRQKYHQSVTNVKLFNDSEFLLHSRSLMKLVKNPVVEVNGANSDCIRRLCDEELLSGDVSTFYFSYGCSSA